MSRRFLKTCNFCGGETQPGKGLMHVKSDGSVLFFCSSKCAKNAKLGRNPKKVKWVTKSKKTKREAIET